MGYHFINDAGTFVNDFENSNSNFENSNFENDYQIDEFEDWNTYRKNKPCPRCGKQIFQMKRHLKTCTGESRDKIKDEVNGTKGWRKGKSIYNPYFDIDKDIGQVNIFS